MVSCITAAFLFAIVATRVHAHPPTLLYEAVKDSVVVVTTLDAQGRKKDRGSGVLLPSGRIATACQVVTGASSYQVEQGQHLFPAMLFAEERDRGICLLEVRGFTGKSVRLGHAAQLTMGARIFVVGVPQGASEPSFSEGLVTQLRGGPPPLIQTTTAISPGQRGGGVFDEEGRLVGLLASYAANDRILPFAMPAEWLGEIKPGRHPAVGTPSRLEWVQRAIVLEESGQWEELLAWCRKWTTSEPENLSAWHSLGFGYLNLQRYSDALAAYRQTVRIKAEDADGWSNLGFVYTELKRYNDAIAAYRQAVQINPDDADGWGNLGWVYALSGNRAAALEAGAALRRLDPEKAETLLHLIDSH